MMAAIDRRGKDRNLLRMRTVGLAENAIMRNFRLLPPTNPGVRFEVQTRLEHLRTFREPARMFGGTSDPS